MFNVEIDLSTVRNLPDEIRQDPKIRIKSSRRGSPIVKVIKRVYVRKPGSARAATRDVIHGYVADGSFWTPEQFRIHYTREGLPRGKEEVVESLRKERTKTPVHPQKKATKAPAQASSGNAGEVKKRRGRPPKGIPGAIPEPGVSYRFVQRKDGRFNVFKVWSRYNEVLKNNSTYKSQCIGISPVRNTLEYLEPTARQAAKKKDELRQTTAASVKSRSPAPLDIVVLVMILATLAVNLTAQAVATFWAEKRRELSDIFDDFPACNISHDMVDRLLNAIGRERENKLMKNLLSEYTKARVELLRRTKPELLRQLCFDGQAVRYSRNEEDRVPYVLNVWDNALGTVVSHCFVGAKHNEITYAADLARSMNLLNCIATADALNTQAEFAAAIREKMGDYCLPAKENQPLLYEDLKYHFMEATAKHDPAFKVFKAAVELGHGRIENRTIRVLDAERLRSELKEKWADLEHGCIVEAITESYDKKTGEAAEPIQRLFISSLLYEADDVAETIYNVVRDHWSVEAMHWRLDVIFCQDHLHCTSSNRLMGAEVINKLADFVLNREIEHQRLLGVPAQELTRPVQRIRFQDPRVGMTAIIRALYPQVDSLPR